MVDEMSVAAADEAVVTEDMIAALKGRAAFYDLLAAIYFRPLTAEQIDNIAEMDWSEYADVNELFADGVNDITRYLRKRNSGTRQALAVDFTSAFAGTSSWKGRYAVPYESVHTSEEGLMFQDAYHEVFQLYKANHVAKAEATTSPTITCRSCASSSWCSQIASLPPLRPRRRGGPASGSHVPRVPRRPYPLVVRHVPGSGASAFGDALLSGRLEDFQGFLPRGRRAFGCYRRRARAAPRGARGEVTWDFAIILAVTIVGCFALRNPLKALPVAFYAAAIAIDVVYVYGVFFGLPARHLEPAVRPHPEVRAVAGPVRGRHVHRMPEPGRPRYHWLKPVRSELSIVAWFLSLGHMAVYLESYLPRLLGGGEIGGNVMGAFVLAVVLLVLLVVLGVTSFAFVKRQMSTASWKKVQKLAYPFFGLVYVHLLLMLLPSALHGGLAAQASVVVYSVGGSSAMPSAAWAGVGRPERRGWQCPRPTTRLPPSPTNRKWYRRPIGSHRGALGCRRALLR